MIADVRETIPNLGHKSTYEYSLWRRTASQDLLIFESSSKKHAMKYVRTLGDMVSWNDYWLVNPDTNILYGNELMRWGRAGGFQIEGIFKKGFIPMNRDKVLKKCFSHGASIYIAPCHFDYDTYEMNYTHGLKTLTLNNPSSLKNIYTCLLDESFIYNNIFLDRQFTHDGVDYLIGTMQVHAILTLVDNICRIDDSAETEKEVRKAVYAWNEDSDYHEKIFTRVEIAIGITQ